MKLYNLSEVSSTVLTNDAGVHQDGVIAYAYDDRETIWTVVGHTNSGTVSVWHGSSFDSIQKQYDARFLFALGRAGYAFHASNYPDGPKSRGQIWPCGLWIQKVTNRFYCLFHNETGWGAGDSSYTIFGQEEGEPDFRHIGLMISDDYGKTWDFAGWILTSSKRCWTDEYNADMLDVGQSGQSICLGCGDFSVWPDEQSQYLYLFYTQHTVYRWNTGCIEDQVFVARCLFRDLDDPSAWRKYDGDGFRAFGNGGNDYALFSHGAVPSVCQLDDQYVMSTYNRAAWREGTCTLQLSFSTDLVHWSPPQRLSSGRPDLSNPYFTLIPDGHSPGRIRAFMSSNGTGIQQFFIQL